MKPTARPSFRRAVPSVQPPVALSDHELLSIDATGYREALYQGWFASGLEQTKSILTLASAGVGLALTLVLAITQKSLTRGRPYGCY